MKFPELKHRFKQHYNITTKKSLLTLIIKITYPINKQMSKKLIYIINTKVRFKSTKESTIKNQQDTRTYSTKHPI